MPYQAIKDQDQPTRVIIIGSGYGGIHACRTLVEHASSEDNLEVILISNTDHFLYTTMVYEVAAGNLAPSSIRQSIRPGLAGRKTKFIQGTVVSVDPDKQTVDYQPTDTAGKEFANTGEISLSYDYLISAIGSETNFLNIPGAEEHAYKLKTLTDAKQIKNNLISHFEEATLITDEKLKKELLSVVIVGGGPTGVTLAAKIADLFNHELSAAFPDLAPLAKITLLESSDKLVAPAGSWFSKQVNQALLDKECIDVATNSFVDEVSADGVKCGDRFLSSRLVVWTAGVKARELTINAEKKITVDDKSRRIHVTPQLSIPTYKNFFVVGDQAWVKHRDDEQPYPMRAQFAVRQGKQAAINILKTLRNQPKEGFFWEDKGLVISVGHGRTFARVFGLKLSGLPATIAYKSIYLLSTIGVRAKLRAVLEWTMNLFLPRDMSEL